MHTHGRREDIRLQSLWNLDIFFVAGKEGAVLCIEKLNSFPCEMKALWQDISGKQLLHTLEVLGRTAFEAHDKNRHKSLIKQCTVD